MQIIINAGGDGTRLWPLSTKKNPKQFAPITDHESLLQKSFFRLIKNYRSDQIWVTTNQRHQTLVIDQLGPNFTGNNVLTEPERRDTFAAVIAHSAVVAAKTSKQETLTFISSDHYIDNTVDYQNYIETFALIDQEIQKGSYKIILPATKPYYPATGYGYIKFDTKSNQKTNAVLAFKEKPNQATAEKFLASGDYFWNLGYFAFTYETLEKIIAELYPEVSPVLESIYQKGLITEEDYAKIPKDSFDFAVLEKSSGLATIDMNLTSWDDLGSFEVVYGYLEEQENNASFMQVDGSGNKVKSTSTRPIALAGVSNLMVIENENGLLIIDPKKSSSKVKEIANWFDK
jgi:mannose-1-phosphate guanylyltransferase